MIMQNAAIFEYENSLFINVILDICKVSLNICRGMQFYTKILIFLNFDVQSRLPRP